MLLYTDWADTFAEMFENVFIWFGMFFSSIPDFLKYIITVFACFAAAGMIIDFVYALSHDMEHLKLRKASPDNVAYQVINYSKKRQKTKQQEAEHSQRLVEANKKAAFREDVKEFDKVLFQSLPESVKHNKSVPYSKWTHADKAVAAEKYLDEDNKKAYRHVINHHKNYKSEIEKENEE